MKRILIITEVFYPENGLINDFAIELVNRGYQVEILTQNPSYPLGKIYEGYENTRYSIENWGEIKIHRFKVIEGYTESKIKKILNYVKFVKTGGKIAKQIGGQFDHILVYQTGPLTVAMPGVKIKRKFGVPLTVWTFDIWPDAVYAYGFPRIFPFNLVVNSIIKKVYRNADNILVSSQKFEEVISKYVPNKSIYYAPNWLVDEQPQKSKITLNKNKFNFSFTGNISKAQNLENVIKGWQKADIHDRAILNIVGDGSAKAELSELVNKKQTKNVVFHGRHPSSHMLEVMNQSDMLVLSLVSDNGIAKTEPFKLQAYLNSGKPIFGVIKGAGKEIIEENSLGLCADPENIELIAEGFIKAIEYAEKHKEKVALSAEKLMKERYDRNKTIERILSHIEKN